MPVERVMVGESSLVSLSPDTEATEALRLLNESQVPEIPVIEHEQVGDICSQNGDCCTGTCTITAGMSVGSCAAAPSAAANCTGCYLPFPGLYVQHFFGFGQLLQWAW